MADPTGTGQTFPVAALLAVTRSRPSAPEVGANNTLIAANPNEHVRSQLQLNHNFTESILPQNAAGPVLMPLDHKIE